MFCPAPAAPGRTLSDITVFCYKNDKNFLILTKNGFIKKRIIPERLFKQLLRYLSKWFDRVEKLLNIFKKDII